MEVTSPHQDPLNGTSTHPELDGGALGGIIGGYLLIC